MNFLGQGFLKLRHRQNRHTHTDRQTGVIERITTAVFAGIKNLGKKIKTCCFSMRIAKCTG